MPISHAKRPRQNARPRPAALKQTVTGALAAFLATLLATPAGATENTKPVLVTFERRPQTPGVTVTIEFTGDADGRSEVTAPDSAWGGFTPDPADFTDIAAASDGSSLSLTAINALGWSVEHPPSVTIMFSYTLREPSSPGREPLPPGRNDYRTAVGPDYFRMFGPLGFLYPKHLRDATPRRHDIRWLGFDSPGFVCASSFGDGPTQSATITADRFINSIYVAGRFSEARRDINGGRLAVLIAGDHWDFTPDEFADLTAGIVRAQRDFFDDHSQPWYLVCVTPQPRAAPGSFSLGGTALTNTFALFCDTGTSLRPNSPHIAHVQRLLAHEYFHSWNGVAFQVRGPEGSNYWFSEGFTDYFTRRMLRLAGRWTDQDILADINDSLARYDANPARHATNDQVIAAFWSDREMADLPYRRGDLAALALDQEIRRRSGGKRTLDDAFRDLIRTNAGREMPDQEALFGFFEAQAGPELAQSVRRFVLDGHDAPLPDSLDEFGASLSTVGRRSMDPGFDLDASREQRRIVGVRGGSAAQAAGLKDGMPFRRISIGADQDKPTEALAEVEIDGEWMTIRYEALGPVRHVRAYQPGQVPR